MILCRFDADTRACQACGYVARVLPLHRICRPPPSVTLPIRPQSGPGRQLKSILEEWLGIKASPTCPCNSMAAKMDRLGPDWCEGDGMPEILDAMRGEHAKRWADGRTRLPWVEAGARQLVLLACRRARAAAST